MPKTPRSEKEIIQVKVDILEKALEILIDEGYDNLSMSKIGKRMNMTAANLYNYYSSKDELYNAISIAGYNRLYDQSVEAIKNQTDPFKKVVNLFKSYFIFGMENAHYYYLMFTMVAPKYLDYVNTPMESIALREKENAMRVLTLAVSIVEEYIKNHPGYTGLDSKLVTIQFWSQIHGIVSLYNSGNLMEADDDPDSITSEVMKNIEKIIKRGFQ